MLQLIFFSIAVGISLCVGFFCGIWWWDKRRDVGSHLVWDGMTAEDSPEVAEHNRLAKHGLDR